MKWYLWEKEPGKIGILWYSQLERHKDTFICDFEGTIEQAIAYAKDLEERGYDVCREKPVKTEYSTDVATYPDEEEEYRQLRLTSICPENAPEAPESTFVDETSKSSEKRPKRRKKAKKAISEVLENYEVEGQISLYDLFPEKK